EEDLLHGEIPSTKPLRESSKDQAPRAKQGPRPNTKDQTQAGTGGPIPERAGAGSASLEFGPCRSVLVRPLVLGPWYFPSPSRDGKVVQHPPDDLVGPLLLGLGLVGDHDPVA